MERKAAPARIMAIDDSQEALFALDQVLSAHGYNVCTVRSGDQALEILKRENFDLVISDINMPGMDGLELARRMKADLALRYVPLILVTARDELEDVIRGLDQGADDYIRKPFRSEELLARVNASLRLKRLYGDLREARELSADLRSQLRERVQPKNIIGQSSAIREVFGLIEKVKGADVPVLISGESGTGKELVAAAIHFQSPRHERRLVVQNCSAFNENLLESELFGHVRGAFTGAVRDKPGLFEVADGGTFFLDELGEMTPALQVKLLRVLQDGTFLPVGGTSIKQVNVRILAATNRDLREMVARGEFREDLFYRLNVVNIKLPPLRERRGDIQLLAEHFLEEIARRSGRAKKVLSVEALRALECYAWPGNIRELQNEIERSSLLSAEEEQIGEEWLSQHIQNAQSSLAQGGPLRQALEALEKQMIRDALLKHSGNKSEAARELGVSRSNLISKVQAYRL